METSECSTLESVESELSGLRAELKKLEDRAGGDPLAPPYRVRHARILKSIERRTKRLNEVKAAAGLC